MSVIDLHKKKGIRPKFDVYIGRKVNYTEFTEDSKWANRFRVSDWGMEKAIEMFEKDIRWKIQQNPEKYNIEELRGKVLGCWCITTDRISPCVCHGQILLKILGEKHEENE